MANDDLWLTHLSGPSQNSLMSKNACILDDIIHNFIMELNLEIEPNYSVTVRAVGVRHLEGKEAQCLFDTQFLGDEAVLDNCFRELLGKLGLPGGEQDNVIVYVSAYDKVSVHFVHTMRIVSSDASSAISMDDYVFCTRHLKGLHAVARRELANHACWSTRNERAPSERT